MGIVGMGLQEEDWLSRHILVVSFEIDSLIGFMFLFSFAKMCILIASSIFKIMVRPLPLCPTPSSPTPPQPALSTHKKKPPQSVMHSHITSMQGNQLFFTF